MWRGSFGLYCRKHVRSQKHSCFFSLEVADKRCAHEGTGALGGCGVVRAWVQVCARGAGFLWVKKTFASCMHAKKKSYRKPLACEWRVRSAVRAGRGGGEPEHKLHPQQNKNVESERRAVRRGGRGMRWRGGREGSERKCEKSMDRLGEMPRELERCLPRCKPRCKAKRSHSDEAELQ